MITEERKTVIYEEFHQALEQVLLLSEEYTYSVLYCIKCKGWKGKSHLNLPDESELLLSCNELENRQWLQHAVFHT